MYTQTCLHFATQGMLDTELFGLAVLIGKLHFFLLHKKFIKNKKNNFKNLTKIVFGLLTLFLKSKCLCLKSFYVYIFLAAIFDICFYSVKQVRFLSFLLLQRNVNKVRKVCFCLKFFELSAKKLCFSNFFN